MRELFIYWRTSAASAEAAEREVRRWQAEQRVERPGLTAALYRRADEGAPAVTSVTLMEAYAGPGLDAACERHLVEAGNLHLARWLDGPRKVEVFLRLEGA